MCPNDTTLRSKIHVAEHKADKVTARTEAERIANEHGDAIKEHEDAAADAAAEIAEHKADKVTARTEVARIAQELRTIAGYPEQLRTIAGEVANLIPEDELPLIPEDVKTIGVLSGRGQNGGGRGQKGGGRGRGRRKILSVRKFMF